MNILLIGSGAREHAMAVKIKESSRCDHLYIIPGNAGTASVGENINISASDFAKLAEFSSENNIEMIIPAAENQLAEGINDYFRNNPQTRHIKIIGPQKAGAALESSKSFSKSFMKKYGIPTAESISITQKNKEEGIRFLKNVSPPYVLKADGLAAGKGVLILNDFTEAQNSLSEMLDGKFGTASETVVLEEFMSGIELSMFIITNGKNYVLLPEAKDYKRIGENDTGLNTGGMGAVSPVPFADSVFIAKVENQIIKPTLEGLQNEKISYLGFLFFGLMNVGGNPKVIEYNVRMGDPESEVVFPRIQSDVVELFDAAATGNLKDFKLKINPQTAATIMLVSCGYPEKFEKGKKIHNLDKIKETKAYHAGTTEKNNELYTNGGRVVSLTSFGNSMNEALQKSIIAAEIIDFEGKYYRKDIGFDLKQISDLRKV